MSFPKRAEVSNRGRSGRGRSGRGRSVQNSYRIPNANEINYLCSCINIGQVGLEVFVGICGHDFLNMGIHGTKRAHRILDGLRDNRNIKRHRIKVGKGGALIQSDLYSENSFEILHLLCNKFIVICSENSKKLIVIYKYIVVFRNSPWMKRYKNSVHFCFSYLWHPLKKNTK